MGASNNQATVDRRDHDDASYVYIRDLDVNLIDLTHGLSGPGGDGLSIPITKIQGEWSQGFFSTLVEKPPTGRA